MISHIFKSLVVLSLLAFIGGLGFITASKQYPRVIDNSANVIKNYWDKKEITPTGEYMFLTDIINVSLDKIKSVASSSVTSTPTKEIIEEAPTDIVAIKPAENLGDAIVNIYCLQETKDFKRAISGTGFIISEKGAILTNAHVAQFLLLQGVSKKTGKVDCKVTTNVGDDLSYKVSLLYISPSWLLEHADLISSETPRGTGENDFALLYISGTNDASPLPEKFPHIPTATSALKVDYKDQTVILVGFPYADSSAKRVVATTTITKLYTFGGGYADIFSLAESPLGYQGASGGPVIDRLGRAIGVITTKDEGTTILNAITTAYIDRTMKTETGFDLISTLQGDLEYRASLFNETVSPILQSILSENL